MVRIRLDEDNLREALSEAVAVLCSGGIIAFPTETFYGLGVKFDMQASLERLYDIKRRPREKAMPVVIGDRGALSAVVSPGWLAVHPPGAEALMETFWPGPLTLLLPAKEGLSAFLTAHTGMIAVRVPGESFALKLSREAGFPFTATSANPSGMPPAAGAERVLRYFGKSLDLLVDGGETPGGLPSTIVGISGTGMKIVREGAVTRKEIEDCLSRQRMKLNGKSF